MYRICIITYFSTLPILMQIADSASLDCKKTREQCCLLNPRVSVRHDSIQDVDFRIGMSCIATSLLSI